MTRKEKSIFALFFIFFVQSNGFHQISGSTINPVQDLDRVYKDAEYAFNQGDYEKVLSEFRRIGLLVKEQPQRGIELRCLRFEGLTLWNLGRISDSRALFERLSCSAGSSGVLEIQNYSQAALKIIALYQDAKEDRKKLRLAQSLNKFHQAIALADQIGCDHLKLKCLRQMGLTYWDQMNLLEYKLETELALKLAIKLNNHREQMDCLNNIGVYFICQDEYFLALKYCCEALEIARRKTDSEVGEIYTNLGIIYANLGDYETGLKYLFRSYELDKAKNNYSNYAKDLNNIGVIMMRSWLAESKPLFYKDAFKRLEEALSVSQQYENRDVEVAALNNLGRLSYLNNDLERSSILLKKGLYKASILNNEEAIGSLYESLANVEILKGKYLMAAQLFNKSIEYSIGTGNIKQLHEAYSGLAKCYRYLDDRPRALLFLDKGIELINKVQEKPGSDHLKIKYIRNRNSLYEDMISIYESDLLGPQKDKAIERIYTVIERSKANIFINGLREAKVDMQYDVYEEQSKKEEMLEKQIDKYSLEMNKPNISDEEKADINMGLSASEEEYSQIIKKYRTDHNDKARRIGIEVLPISQVCDELLSDRIAILEYFLGKDGSWLVYIQGKRLCVYKMPPSKDIEKSVKGFVKAIMSPEPNKFVGYKAAERLGKELIPPIDKIIKSRIDTIIVIPDGILNYLPFEALRVFDGKKCEYIVERYKISYAMSLSSLDYIIKSKWKLKHNKIFMGISGPSEAERKRGEEMGGLPLAVTNFYRGQGYKFDEIEYGEAEIQKCARFFKAEDVDILIGEQATEETIKSTQMIKYNIIHFACHGIIEERFPLRTALVLSTENPQEEDGFLQVREINKIRIKANLVVLSACHSARGAYGEGEGILGLPRIFFYSGADSVLGSLWNINDKATTIFMEIFYRHIAAGRSKNDALRRCKREMIRSKYGHPYYWAAFILYGEFDSCSKKVEN